MTRLVFLAENRKKKLRSRHKKLKAYDLSSLSEFLPEFRAAPRQPLSATNSKLNAKSRQKLIEKEGKQLRMVLNHPAYQLDPLSAIHQHLENTKPIPIKKPGQRSCKSGKKAKGKKSKASSGVQSMDTSC
ncbi:hypothetical protein HHK36_002644 [Tetracentron sinense]|uniref:Ribosome biogenesis protein slx9-like n=1 Tax=Tetracentron sinense TaxID=13715 RepID=A0A834ZWV4_TETSI|nr:hypothetical protein HHK36_002644 [Tetracentron sinense]